MRRLKERSLLAHSYLFRRHSNPEVFVVDRPLPSPTIQLTMFHRIVQLGVLISLAGGCAVTADKSSTPSKTEGVKLTQQDGKIRVEMGGKLFTEYYFKDVSRPFLYPIIGLGGSKMTRNWPMQEAENEEHDHPHHRSLWYAHGNVNGQDFWSESDKAGKTVHEKFLEVSSGKKSGVIRAQNKWVAKDGTVIATDDTTIRFSGNANRKIIDYEVTIHAAHGEITMGDTKEGTMAVRLAETMRLTQPKGKSGQGHIVNSEGVRDGETWGKRASWCDYYGPVNDKTVGVAMFDHPKNPQHPTWWHVRDYGLFAANPYGVHEFEKKPAGAGNFIIPAGKSVTYRYRFVFHEGDERQAGIAELFKKYAAE